MIGRLIGVLAGKSPPQILVDVNGVGYEVDVPMSSFYNLPGLGERITLLTHFVVREDAQLLYGFLTHDKMRQQGDALAEAGQVVEAAHRHVEIGRAHV